MKIPEKEPNSHPTPYSRRHDVQPATAPPVYHLAARGLDRKKKEVILQKRPRGRGEDRDMDREGEVEIVFGGFIQVSLNSGGFLCSCAFVRWRTCLLCFVYSLVLLCALLSFVVI